jgi:Thoeris protein ThsB, TIR-like domain
MARQVFFSFHYDRDHWRVSIVRNSQVISGYDKNPFYDKADWEKIKRKGDGAVRNWIDTQMKGSSVTVVLLGKETGSRRWVKYEIKRSQELGKGLVGVDISHISNQHGETDKRGSNPLPSGTPVYLWNKEAGHKNLGRWIEAAAPR